MTRHTATNSSHLLDGCEEVLKLHPGSLAVTTYLSLIYSACQQNDKAIEVISNVINSRPRLSTPYYIRCGFYLLLNQYDQAKRDYLRGLKSQMRTDKEFKRKFSDEVIESATIDNKEELDNIKEIANYVLKKQSEDYANILDKYNREARIKYKKRMKIN